MTNAEYITQYCKTFGEVLKLWNRETLDINEWLKSECKIKI